MMIGRDEKTLEPTVFRHHLPKPIEEDVTVFILDPMLATGGTACMAISLLKQRGARKIIFAGIVGCPKGVERVSTFHPEIPIFLFAVDERLDEHGFIVPGLGDAGDRQFGTH
jgi:uracil phosphoribosyltransferase